MQTPKIALFDSGVGGLNLLSALRKKIFVDYVYFADTKHMPYGSRSSNEIRTLAARIIQFLSAHDPTIIIIACHTISAHALDYLTNLTETPLIGVIDLVCQAAATETKTGKIGILATPATIKSHAHATYLKKISDMINIIEQPCPDLATHIEQNPANPKIPFLIETYAKALLKEAIDTVILGCTHYEVPSVVNEIQKIVGSDVCLIKASDLITTELIKKNLLYKKIKPTTTSIYVTGDPALFFRSMQLLDPSLADAKIKQALI